MWDLQVADLLPYFRILRYDMRGHGASSVTEGEYSMDQLGRDVLSIADALNIEKFAFCGLSIGGMAGQSLAANAPGRVTHLVLANTTPRMASPADWEARRLAVLLAAEAPPAVADAAMQRFFSKETWDRRDPRAASIRATVPRHRPLRLRPRLRRHSRYGLQTPLLAKIQAPTLLIVGDLATFPLPGRATAKFSRAESKTPPSCAWTPRISRILNARAASAPRCSIFFCRPPRAIRSRPATKCAAPCSGNAHVDKAMATATTISTGANFRK